MPGYVYILNTMGDNETTSFPYKRFGVRWYKNESPTGLTRLYNSIGKNFIAANLEESIQGYSDFDNEPIFKDIRLCNMINGVVTAYEGEPGFSRIPSAGDVMVEIPKYYYKIIDTEEYRDYLISNTKADITWNCSPRHSDYDGHGERDKIYVSAYNLNSAYRCISGENIKLSYQSRAMIRQKCSLKASGYYSYDFATYWTIGLLYLVEVADLNSSNKIGLGQNFDNNCTSGLTDNIGFHSGTNTNVGNDCMVKYRNIENLYISRFQHCDGINFYLDKAYICLDPLKYTENLEDTINNYIKLNYNITFMRDYAVSLGIDDGISWAQIPVIAGGSSNTYISDTFEKDDNEQLTQAYMGSGTGGSTSGGFFHISAIWSCLSQPLESLGRCIYLP